jgi:hypothetical protein
MTIRTPAVDLPAAKTGKTGCDCGVPACDGTCCELSCLVQPRFFCGQLLTDQDLTALLTWSQDKFRLTRYRDGWGVVCGLQVRCDRENPGHVVVEPGYALDCCGNDILVCEPVTYDLTAACRPDKDPCEELGQSEEGYGRSVPTSTDRLSPTTFGEAMRTNVPSRLDESWRSVDLYLSYAEKGTRATATLGRNGCNQLSDCEYARTEETFALRWRPAVDADPVAYLARKWREQYLGCVQVVTAFSKMWSRWQQSYLTRENLAAKAHAWLLRWLEKNPTQQYCGLRDMICDLSADAVNQRSLLEPLFHLAQDCRNSFLQGHCHACLDDPGVPLARIWLQRDGDKCRVQLIDSVPPYRRPRRHDRWPALPGTVNGGQVIWYRYEDACVVLRGLGVNVAGRHKPDNVRRLTDLQDLLRQDPFLPVCNGQPVTLIVINLDGTERVIGFDWGDDDSNGDTYTGIPQGVAIKPADAAADKKREDDLTVIPGIGEKSVEKLRAAGVDSYRKLAETSVPDLKKIIERGVGESNLEQWRVEAESLMLRGSEGE